MSLARTDLAGLDATSQAELVRRGELTAVDDVAALLDAAGPPLAPDTLRVVAHWTGGNPLLVTELAAELRSLGGLGDPVTALAVPESVRALVAARCARLPEAGRRALAAGDAGL